MYPCISRLSSPNTAIIGNSLFTARAVTTCPNKVSEQMSICPSCKMIPIDVPISMRLIHGKLCDEIPKDSRIYGSYWYWKAIAKYGNPADTKWLAFARNAQFKSEEVCGKGAYKIQRPNDIPRQIDMGGKKAQTPKDATASSATDAPAANIIPIPVTILPKESPIIVKKSRKRRNQLIK